ncbi:hypothetical protein ACGF7W_34710 [Streptomyces sp. NPDC048219]|uniref:hypothetical protein n=1 Tax=Streptomyces TaxID=1883 RepID=UPI00371DB06F
MDWIVTATQQTASSSSPVWLSALLGGVGAMLGGSITSVVAWRVLSDTKSARRRAEEREASAAISAALLKVRQKYKNDGMGTDRLPEGFDTWPDYFHSLLGEAEVAVLTFTDRGLRDRLTGSLDLLIWGAHDDQLLHESRLSFPRVVAYAAYNDALACLGANLRNEPLPNPTDTWTTAHRQLQWQEEQVRRAEAGE